MPTNSRTIVRNMPRYKDQEVHTDDPFGGNDNNRKAHENRLKIEAALKPAEPVVEVPPAPPVAPVAPAPVAPAFVPPAPPSFGK